LEEKENIQFQLTDQLIEQVKVLIEQKNDKELKKLLDEYHYADIAEILDEVNLEEAMYVIKLLDSETTADILMELDEDNREKVLRNLSAKEIAEEIEELDTDDAADIIAELPEERQHEVISKIEDLEHKAEIKELLKYDEDTAGGLMAKELVKVYETWTVAGCLRRIRGQAKDVTRVHSIYVVDKQEKLVGRLSLKDLITAKSDQKIAELCNTNVDYVFVDEEAEEVARIMQKYVDVIREEADKDYQMAAGISQDVEADDSIFKLTRARLPWLLIGVVGGIGAASIIDSFSGNLGPYIILLSFVPLIQGTAGNVGVQSSAIIVQGLANGSIGNNVFKRLLKELLLGLVNGIAIGLLAFIITHFIFGAPYNVSFTIGIALITVIIMAALIGTFIPIFLDKKGIDPAVATGPFITTSNDIFGVFLYFLVAKIILGF